MGSIGRAVDWRFRGGHTVNCKGVSDPNMLCGTTEAYYIAGRSVEKFDR